MAGKAPAQAKVVVFGLTFKENCPDIRNSKVVDIIKRLKEYNIDPIVIDPWANKQEAKLEYGVELKDISEAKEVDCIIVAVAHNKFKNFPLEDLNKLGDILYSILDKIENSPRRDEKEEVFTFSNVPLPEEK